MINPEIKDRGLFMQKFLVLLCFLSTSFGLFSTFLLTSKFYFPYPDYVFDICSYFYKQYEHHDIASRIIIINSMSIYMQYEHDLFFKHVQYEHRKKIL